VKPEELDDTAPVEPDDHLLSTVHTRSRAFRRRRTTQRLTSVMAGAVVIALAAGIAWSRSDTSGNRQITLPAATSTTSSTTTSTTTNTAPPEPTAQTAITGTWLAYTIAGFGYIGKGPPLRPALPSDPKLAFDGLGRWTGSDGCNQLSGSYTLDENGIHFDPQSLRSTAINCGPDVPDFAQIEKAARSEVRDNQLTFFSADGNEIARFLRPDVMARIELPSTKMTAGSKMTGHVVVENNTGHVIEAGGCGSLFQVQLGNDVIHPDPLWTLCAQPLPIPIGESSYPVTFYASYPGCSTPAQGDLKACIPNVGPPPLPPGNYQAEFFQSSPVVYPALPIDVTVVP
jgi:heat shock protein HslJ